MTLLKIKGLRASLQDTEILKGIDLEVNYGEVHAIMGPNGSGKSTLSKVIIGHPDYEVTGGSLDYEINFKSKDLLGLSPDERAREGVFLAFQYPVEVPGVNNAEFLRAAFNSISTAQGGQEWDAFEFDQFLKEKMDLLNIDHDYITRQVNVDFSGGEKKRNEILQLAVLSPRLALLDETDSGLDVDSLRLVADGVNKLRSKDNGMVLITHYQRLLNYVVPDYVHILYDGKIIRSGGKELALEVEEKGYEHLIS